MKKITIFVVIIIGVIIISAWLIFSGRNLSIFQRETEVAQESILEESKKEISLIIDDGEGSPETFKIEFEEGMTTFDLLKEGTSELDLALRTKSYDIGIFIEAIGDKENGQDEKYWMYYINEEMPMVAADKKEIKAGDKVEFKFEESSF